MELWDRPIRGQRRISLLLSRSPRANVLAASNACWLAVQLVGPDAPARNVIPVKVDAGPSIGEANFEAAGLGHRFVLDYADRHWASLPEPWLAETKQTGPSRGRPLMALRGAGERGDKLSGPPVIAELIRSGREGGHTQCAASDASQVREVFGALVVPPFNGERTFVIHRYLGWVDCRDLSRLHWAERRVRPDKYRRRGDYDCAY